jgi:hypothetical protein
VTSPSWLETSSPCSAARDRDPIAVPILSPVPEESENDGAIDLLHQFSCRHDDNGAETGHDACRERLDHG